MPSLMRNEAVGRIVQTAEREFLRWGFRRVLMDDLAHELGMSKKTLYAHFAGKEPLLRAVLEHRVSEIDRGLNALVMTEAAFPRKFRDVAQFVQSRMAEVSPDFLADIRRHAPECFAIVEEFRARAIPRYFGRLIDEGVRAGYLDSGVNRELLIRMLALSIQGIIRPEVMAGLQIHPSAALDQILGIVFNGILTPQGRRNRRQFPLA